MPDAPAPPPALVASAEEGLPEEIAAAIEDLMSEVFSFGAGDPHARMQQATAALTAAILSRLTAADTYPSGEPTTDLDHARYDRDGWMESALRAQGYVGELQGRLAAALARAERAEAALEPLWQRARAPGADRIPDDGTVTVFMKDCREALAALAQPAPAEEEEP